MLGNDLTVKFTALESAKVPTPKVPKHQDEVLNEVLDEVLENRIANKLKESGRIVRKGGKRFGYWEVNEV